MELELGDYDCEARDRSNCVVLGEKIREFFTDFVDTNHDYFHEGKDDFWKQVERVIEKREKQLRKAHKRRLGWAIEAVNALIIGIPTPEEEAHVERLTKTAKHQADKDLKAALKRARGRRQFEILYNRTYREWKTERDRNLKTRLHTCIRNNRMLREISSDTLLELRVAELDNELMQVKFYMSRDNAHWDMVDWLWHEPNTIDSQILGDRTLEDYCYGE